MGAGIQGGGLTGGGTPGIIIAPTGQSAIVAGPLGAGATDVVVKIGSTVADASVNSAAKLASVRTGVNGTEVEYFSITKAQATTGNLLAQGTGGANIPLRAVGGAAQSGAFFRVENSGFTPLVDVDSSGRLNVYFAGMALYGTDNSGTPGASTTDKPSGKNAIALGAASVVVTCSLCTAASRVMITPQTRDATCKELIAVPGAGSFTVSGSAVATAALTFSWEINNIL